MSLLSLNKFPLHSQLHQGLLLGLLVMAIYGAWPPAAKAAYAVGANASYVLLWAMLARALPLCAICFVQKQRLFPTREDTKQAFFGGAMQALSTSLLLAAAAYLPGPLVIIMICLHSLMLFLYMAWRGDTKLDAVTIAIILAALGGLSFALDIWHAQSGATWQGMGMAFLSALVIVRRMYLYGHQTKIRNPAVVGAENFITANLFMPLILLFQTPHAPTAAIGYVWTAVACIVLAIPTCMQFYALAKIGSFRFSLLSKLEPIFTSIYSALLLGEILKPIQYAGMMVVIGCLVLYQWIDYRRAKFSEATP